MTRITEIIISFGEYKQNTIKLAKVRTRNTETLARSFLSQYIEQ